MSKKYDICARLEIQGRDKPVWPKIGMTLTIKDNGHISLYDSRTGQNYFCFERQEKSQQNQNDQAGKDAFDDTIPF